MDIKKSEENMPQKENKRSPGESIFMIDQYESIYREQRPE